MLREPESRLRLITMLIVAVTLLIVAQLVRLQVLEHAAHQAAAQELVRRQYSLPDPPWGCIRDRNGDLLVGNAPRYDVGAEFRRVVDPAEAAALLAPLLNRPVAEVQEDLTLQPEDEEHGFGWHLLARQVSPETAEKLEELWLPWLTLTPTWERCYAEGALAAHILGFVNEDGLGYGVQAYQRRFLQGQRVVRVGDVSGDAQPLAGEVASEEGLPYPGTDLRLTLDRTIQAYVEGELDKALLNYDAQGGVILVLDPRTGEILAAAARPSYEPVRYADYAAQGETAIFRDPAISQTYEPGSVFKIVTVAAALDSGRADMNWSYQDRGTLEYGGVVVQNWDRNPYGQQDLAGLLTHSLNVGAAKLSTQVLGPELFYRYVRAFGFGQPTGVELAGEAAGLVHMPSDWNWEDGFLATNSFGQGIAVTPLQMAAAVAAIANEGVMMQPHVVAERLYPDGRSIVIPPRPAGQPVAAETAHLLSELLEHVVDEMPEAQVPGYRIAGKTGTAQIPGMGGYEQDAVITSFVGFGPLPDPQLLILVKLDRPGVPAAMRWGTQTAAPLFQKVAARLFVLLGIPPAAD
ncbi:MAG: penicillin-binding protein 2 [Anaerolineae bacterium]|nr:penicillin-binding protein 2 [Anaerolineae bacterium]